MSRKLASVVLVGRPNVGKSTLFNRMTGSRRAIVAPVAGTTRDALTRPVDWRGTRFDLFDTGGLFGASEDPLHELVVEQGQRAIAGADLLVMLVDGREGLVSGDERIASELRQTGRPGLVAINKTDDKRARASMTDFFGFGFDPVLEISAQHGDGVAELLDAIVERLRGADTRVRPDTDTVGGDRTDTVGADHINTVRSEHADAGRAPHTDTKRVSDTDTAGADPRVGPAHTPQETRVAIVGRPNVGKSWLCN